MPAQTASVPIASSVSPAAPSRALHRGLWVAQGLVAAAFLMAGSMKLTVPAEQLATQMPWVSGAMGPFTKLIGAAEIAGALGLVLPSMTRIQPRLTVFAALGLSLLMAGAAGTHLVRGEAGALGAPLVLGALAAFIAWGRTKKAPIASRGSTAREHGAASASGAR
jgi:hypothetical protein